MTYTQRRHPDGSYSCSCMAWKKQYAPPNQRTCKHLIAQLGAAHERKRAPASFRGDTRKPPTTITTHPLDPPPMRYHRWTPDQDVTGWWASIKLNGIWARWEHGHLFTKSGRELHPPPSITQHLPPRVSLNGELMGQRNHLLHDQWTAPATFWVFDLVDPDQPFEKRWKRLQALQRQYGFQLIPHQKIRSLRDLQVWQQRVDKASHEGLVLRNPQGRYEGGKRSRTTLKWKPWHQARGRVMGRESRKTRDVLLVHYQNHVLKLTVPKTFSPRRKHVTFRYSGKDERGRPEIPQLLHGGKR